MVTQLAPRGSAMGGTGTDVAGRRGRSRFVVVLAAVLGVLAAGIAVGVLLTRAVAEDPAATRPAATASGAPTATPAAALRWEEVGGVRLPFSTVHGPRSTDLGRAAGYSRDAQGAALAAVQVLLRTTPSAGSDVFLGALAAQVTGANTAALQANLLDQYATLRARVDVVDGAPIPGTTTEVRGYVVRSLDLDAGTALVDVVLTSPDLTASAPLVAFNVAVQWSYDDWRVLAPPLGDWAQVATPLTTAPAGMLTYDQIG